jgi:hypothetical protein
MDHVPIEMMQPTAIEVLGEQPDGPSELELKRIVASIFKGYPTVAEAYLLRVRYAGEDDPSVALCLRFTGAQIDEQVINEAGMAFHTLFGRDSHLDIIPLTEEMTKTLEARPFYVARFATSA